MEQALTQPVAHDSSTSFVVKLLTYAVWIGSGLLFWQVGGAMNWPRDPHATLSIADLSASGRMLPVVVILVAISSAAATLILRRWFCDAGLMAVSIGLAALSVRGSTVESLLIAGADGGGPGQRALALLFAIELLIWSVLLLLSAVIGARLASAGRSRESARASSSPVKLEPAAWDISALRPWTRAVASPRAAVRTALAHAGMAAAIMIALRIVLCIDVIARPISHGQALFVPFASSFIAVSFAFKRFPVRSPLWGMAASVGVSFVGYLLALLSGDATDLPPNLPGSPFLRMLPVQAAASGVGGVLWGLWFVFDPALLGPVAADARVSVDRTSRAASSSET